VFHGNYKQRKKHNFKFYFNLQYCFFIRVFSYKIDRSYISDQAVCNLYNQYKLDINKAEAKDFIALPGIGYGKAKVIVEYRNNNGEFICIEDLLKVKGIGKKILQGMKDRIKV